MPVAVKPSSVMSFPCPFHFTLARPTQQVPSSAPRIPRQRNTPSNRVTPPSEAVWPPLEYFPTPQHHASSTFVCRRDGSSLHVKTPNKNTIRWTHSPEPIRPAPEGGALLRLPHGIITSQPETGTCHIHAHYVFDAKTHKQQQHWNERRAPSSTPISNNWHAAGRKGPTHPPTGRPATPVSSTTAAPPPHDTTREAEQIKQTKPAKTDSNTALSGHDLH